MDLIDIGILKLFRTFSMNKGELDLNITPSLSHLIQTMVRENIFKTLLHRLNITKGFKDFFMSTWCDDVFLTIGGMKFLMRHTQHFVSRGKEIIFSPNVQVCIGVNT